MRASAAWLSLLMMLAGTCLAAPSRRTQQMPVPLAGENIYVNGVLSTGDPLRGERGAGSEVSGSAAACTNCHRRSGLGEIEGRALVPPVTATYLYRPRSSNRPTDLQSAALTMAEPGARPEMPREAGRDAYTDATLAQAIREGVGPDGRQFDYLMPRFKIGDSDMASLIAYLKQLSRHPSPGVGQDTLQFATIITPEADPIKRDGMLDVLQHFFGPQNMFTAAGQGPPPQLSQRFTPIAHRWQLHVWQLTGAPESWESQLDERLRHEPVFAAISGIGGKTWEPVHRFCQRSSLPCLFPNVDLPPDAEQDFYDVYFSKGVLLEAGLIADRLNTPTDAGAPPVRPQRVVQFFRRDDIGRAAAAELRRALRSAATGVSHRAAIEVVDHALDPGASAVRLQQLVSSVGRDEDLVLWLRPSDIESLPTPPPPASAVFASGIMAGLERAPFAIAWREVVQMAYPFDLPQVRAIRMDYPLGWMHFKKVPVVDERTQTDTWLACLATSETVSMIGQDLVRDHLLETLEMHLGTRLVNGYYPRLGLAPGQRFASKGGFLVRFADAQSAKLVADGDWSVP